MPVEVTPVKTHPSKRGSLCSTACQRRSASNGMATTMPHGAEISRGNRTLTKRSDALPSHPPERCATFPRSVGGGLTRRELVRQGVLGAGVLATASWALPEFAFAQDTIKNLIVNPRAAVSLSGWTGYAPAGIATPPARRSSTGLNTPPSCAELTFTSADHLGALHIGRDGTTPCAPGDVLWVQATGSMVYGSPGAELRLTIAYLDALGRTFGSHTLHATTATPGAWSVLSGFDTAPTQAVACYVGVWLAATKKAQSVVRATNVMVVANPPTVPDYFDGSSPGCSWKGTAHASPSIGPAPVPVAPARAGFLRGGNDNAVIQGGWTPADDAALNADMGTTVLRVACDLRGGW